jgi:hypothetical protein
VSLGEGVRGGDEGERGEEGDDGWVRHVLCFYGYEYRILCEVDYE